MSEKSKETAEQHVKAIRRATRKQYPAEEKIRIVLEGLRGEQSIVRLPPVRASAGLNAWTVQPFGGLKFTPKYARQWYLAVCA